MKKLLFLLAPVMLIMGCAESIDQSELTPRQSDEEIFQAPPRNLDEAVFHEGAQSWMIPQNDPYTLENFQKAYDKLASGASSQPLTRSQMDEFSALPKLEATHYALRIFPKNEDEQWKIELMEDVKVAYMPFNQTQLSEEEIERLPVVKTRSGSEGASVSEDAVFPESYRYTVTYTDSETSESETHILPILHVVWPVEKPLPEDMEYEMDYEVFLPQSEVAKTRSAGVGVGPESLQMLEDEAVSLALGVPVYKRRAGTRANELLFYGGKVSKVDAFLRSKNKPYAMPMHGLKVQFKLGSSIWNYETDYSGYFSTYESINPAASCHFIFQHEKWKITSESGTTPLSYLRMSPVHPALYLRNGLDCIFPDRDGAHLTQSIHMAMDYFYNDGYGGVFIPRWYQTSGLRVRSINRKNDKANGQFVVMQNGEKYISIWNNNEVKPLINHGTISTVWHELGHFVQYCLKGSSANNFNAVHDLVMESFANYVSWHISDYYYLTRGYQINPNIDLDDYNPQDWRKEWTVNNNATYSPMIIDLVDDYDQYYLGGAGRNHDPINGMNVGRSFDLVLEIAEECTTWSSVKTKLQQNVGIYYTSSDLNLFIAPYDYWFARN